MRGEETNLVHRQNLPMRGEEINLVHRQDSLMRGGEYNLHNKYQMPDKSRGSQVLKAVFEDLLIIIVAVSVNEVLET